MATKNAEAYEDGGLGFDPIEFANNLYNTIKSYRSRFGPMPNELITSPEDFGSASSQGENRINTFYRLLGLPATRDEDILNIKKINAENKLSLLGQDGTLNYFSNIVSAKELTARDNVLNQPITGARFNELLKNPLNYLDSYNTKESRRAQIFPLVVDASIPIYPLERMVAPLFFGTDYTMAAGDKILSRPFIEHVIYIRTKVLSGFQDGKVLDELRINIKKVLPKGSVNILDSITPSVVEAYIIQKFIQTLNKLVESYTATKAKASHAIKDINYTPGFVSNPEQRSGDAEDSTDSVEGFALDEKIRDLELVLKEKESMIYLLPTDFVTKSDLSRREDEELNIHNFKSDVFVSHFTDLITYEANEIRSELSTAKNERARKIQAIEEAKRDLMYFTGEFTGLSIFDIICVLYALFTVDIKYIIGLLNKDAQERFKSDPFFSNAEQPASATPFFKKISDILPGGGEAASISESLSALENKVKEAFTIASAFEAQKAGPK